MLINNKIFMMLGGVILILGVGIYKQYYEIKILKKENTVLSSQNVLLQTQATLSWKALKEKNKRLVEKDKALQETLNSIAELEISNDKASKEWLGSSWPASIDHELRRPLTKSNNY